MEARNRKLEDWYGKIRRGEIKLPRFQRFEAWDRQRIGSLIETVIHNLPLGITLVLEVDREQFVSRFLETAPQHSERVFEHLLDGQQRLTALWRVLHNNYERESYFIYLAEFDRYEHDEERDDLTVYSRTRYTKRNGERYPLWCDEPAKTLVRGMIPTQLLRPEDIQDEIEAWVDAATAAMKPDGGTAELEAYFKFRQRVGDRIRDLRAIVKNYNLPYLSLPSDTDKTTALNVFINMNTNSKPLTPYDIIVAEVESLMGRSLHDLEAGLNARHPDIGRYETLSSLILTTSALLQGYTPNQRGAWDMDKRQMVERWGEMQAGLSRMAAFLRGEGIYDDTRLPTNAVLAVIAALYTEIPESGDQRGRDELLLKRYLWHAFFTDRYENAAPTNAYADFQALQRVIRGAAKKDGTPMTAEDVPIFAEHSFVDVEELLTAEWPKRATIRGRAILAAACRLGALDFSTGERLDAHNIADRHYHHVFPDALLKEADIDGFLALNCALIADKTNITIGRKEPLQYLKDRYEWTTEAIVRERLQSHLIPIAELANGGYEGLSPEAKADKLRTDFDAFLRKRAELVMQAARLLAEGHQLSPTMIYEE